MAQNVVHRKNRYKRNKRPPIALTLVVVAVIFAVVAAAVILISQWVQKAPAEDASTPSIESSSEISSGMSSESSQEEESSSLPPESSETAPSSTVSSETPASSGSSADPIGDFFENTVFIGDSRTEGLRLFGVAPDATFYSAEGLAINTVYTQPAVDLNGQKVTVPAALKQQSFEKVYVMFGINELGWPVDSFVSRYGAFLDDVRAAQPQAVIYVQNIFPVTQNKSASDSIYNNTNIRTFNAKIKAMVEEKGLRYVDLYSAFQDESGNLPVGVSPDGVHLEREYCRKWVEYLAANP